MLVPSQRHGVGAIDRRLCACFSCSIDWQLFLRDVRGRREARYRPSAGVLQALVNKGVTVNLVDDLDGYVDACVVSATGSVECSAPAAPPCITARAAAASVRYSTVVVTPPLLCAHGLDALAGQGH
jgi:hypothetical protein